MGSSSGQNFSLVMMSHFAVLEAGETQIRGNSMSIGLPANQSHQAIAMRKRQWNVSYSKKQQLWKPGKLACVTTPVNASEEGLLYLSEICGPAIACINNNNKANKRQEKASKQDFMWYCNIYRIR
jgi:hypothetical protein